MQEKSESIDSQYAYLEQARYFPRKKPNAMGHATFLRSPVLYASPSPLDAAWEKKNEADSVYYTNPGRAYRLWLESLLFYIKHMRKSECVREVLHEVIIFADSISTFIHSKHVRVKRIFSTVRGSLDYQMATLRQIPCEVEASVQSAYAKRLLVVPGEEIEAYIEEALNSIYYN
ncbi:uncharacterized protein NEMAJ01_1558 [Nematocida major]|uniref:uncharacterized protein n=1 Tax=Nematocida major TaxID=1912982 RepID=UPI002008C25E|nr:uncharacterized protein NEMAJ01_1558 [Nematocida major]KAH9386662.1 hypothetical protein NEMAJ01_1558 [Nematocida major]